LKSPNYNFGFQINENKNYEEVLIYIPHGGGWQVASDTPKTAVMAKF
jgi:hypothetical protein